MTGLTDDGDQQQLQVVEKGIALCRAGRWKEGLVCLAQVAEADRERLQLGSLFYSYLGYGIARYQRRYWDGLSLCEHAVRMEFFQPENHLNLARTYLLRRNRRKAVEALHNGLRLDGTHGGLRRLQRDLGYRSRPVISFLSREHPINRWFGWLRHRVRKRDGDG